MGLFTFDLFAAMKLRIATYNIHKGVTGIIRRNSLNPIRTGLYGLDADLIFLQEVQDKRPGKINNAEWIPPSTRSGSWQLDLLAGEHYPYAVYGKNITRHHKHQGNAILSRYPILSWDNLDISDHRLEHRGLLHAVIQIEQHQLHAICVHLGLFAGSRERQIEALIQRVTETVPTNAPLLIAGDFNDWRKRLHEPLMQALDVHEVYAHKGLARTFPSSLPWLQLDRIYIRHATLLHSHVIHGKSWANCSDHRPLLAELALI